MPDPTFVEAVTTVIMEAPTVVLALVALAMSSAPVACIVLAIKHLGNDRWEVKYHARR